MVADKVYKNVEDVRKEIHLAFSEKVKLPNFENIRTHERPGALQATELQLDNRGVFHDLIPDGLDLE